MWRWAYVSVLIVTLGVGSADAGDREKAPDVGVVPKVVRTIQIPNNNNPAWSSRWVDMPSARDSKADDELTTQTAGATKPVPSPVRAAEAKEVALQPPVRG